MALLDDLRDQEIRDRLNLADLQSRRRIRHSLSGRPQIGLLEPVTSTVAICEPVECRHAGSGPSAFDDHDQVLPIEPRLSQVGAIGHLAVHLATIARPTVAGLAVGLLPEQSSTFGNIRWIGSLCPRDRTRKQNK
jgi:hypothetical protein